jgi:hypothetical protein
MVCTPAWRSFVPTARAALTELWRIPSSRFTTGGL